VRTNSESIVAITARDDSRDFTASVAITSSIYPDPDTHIEVVTYGRNADGQVALMGNLTEGGDRRTRPLHFVLGMLRHPRAALRLSWPRHWARRTVILLVMQTLDSAIRIKVKRRLPGGAIVLTTEQDPDKPNIDLVPAAYDAAKWFAARLPGTPQASMPEAALAIPSTAHLLGGAVIASSPATGVVDSHQRVFGYESLLVCDGAAVPANVGVNPSLTIAAMAERAIAHVPAKSEVPR